MTLKNPSHERFAQLVASGKSQSDAYREVYPRSRQWRDESVHERASKVNAKVLPRLQEIQAATAEKVAVDKARLVAFLIEVVETPADQVGSGSKLLQKYRINADGSTVVEMPNKIDAVDKISRLLGFYEPDKQEICDRRIEPDPEILSILQK